MSHKPKELRSRGIVTAYINDLEDKGLKKSNKRPVSEVNEGVPLRVTGSSGLPIRPARDCLGWQKSPVPESQTPQHLDTGGHPTSEPQTVKSQWGEIGNDFYW